MIVADGPNCMTGGDRPGVRKDSKRLRRQFEALSRAVPATRPVTERLLKDGMRVVRLPTAFVLVLGGVFSFLPVLFLLAEKMRNLGKYTLADVLVFRTESRNLRVVVALSTITTGTFVLLAQLVAAGVVVALPKPSPASWPELAVAVLGGAEHDDVTLGSSGAPNAPRYFPFLADEDTTRSVSVGDEPATSLFGIVMSKSHCVAGGVPSVMSFSSVNVAIWPLPSES